MTFERSQMLCNHHRPKREDHRRMFLSGFALAAFIGLTESFSAHSLVCWGAEDTTKSSKEQTFRVRIVTELKGDVHFKNLSDPKSRTPRSVPIESKSTLDFEEECRIDSEPRVITAVRHYREAIAENRLAKQPIEVGLRTEVASILYRQDSGEILINSPHNPITPLEKDLVQGAINPSALDMLLPKAPIKVGSEWSLLPDDAEMLFQLDSVQKCEVTIKLVSADNKVGQLELRGTIVGAARGNATTMQIEGKCQVDRTTAKVTWLAVTIDEERSVGLVEPGFKITARVRVLREPVEASYSQLSLSRAEALVPSIDVLRLLEYRSDAGGFRFLADRTWHIIAENKLETVLRLIQDNTVVSQCNISSLEVTESGVQITLEGYQAEIQRSLGTAFQQFVEASEKVTESGLRMIRIVSVGEVEQVPIQWINIHLSNDEGRHASLVFSMDASLAESFGTSDLQIAGAFEFLELPSIEESSTTSEQISSTEGSTKKAAVSQAVNPSSKRQ